MPSDEKLSEKMIGETYNGKNIDKIKNANFEIIKIPEFVSDICILTNNRLLTTNNDSIIMFDDKFNIVKTLEKPGCNGIASNNLKNFIYVTNEVSHCVYMMDLDLNVLKTFGSEGSDNTSLNKPYGVCFKDDRLYVCDYFNFRIQILNSDLEYVDTLKLSCAPFRIKISGSSIGITGHDDSILFYDLNTHELKKQHFNFSGRISEIDSLFYLITPSKMLCCFAMDGNLIKEENIDRFSNHLLNRWEGIIFYFNKTLIMTNGITTFKFI